MNLLAVIDTIIIFFSYLILTLCIIGAWKMPINVTQESYDRVRNNHVTVKRKRLRPNANFPDQENNDLSTADIIITNINPPPIEYRH